MSLLALPDRDTYRNVLATLTYKRYPGSGTNLRPPDVARMEWADILWWYHWLSERWEQESKALSKGNR